jgi:hypothetical protein
MKELDKITRLNVTGPISGVSLDYFNLQRKLRNANGAHDFPTNLLQRLVPDYTAKLKVNRSL